MSSPTSTGLFTKSSAPLVEGGDLLGLALACRENDDRHIRPLGKPENDLFPVHVRKAKVQDHYVWSFGRNLSQSVRPMIRPQHVVVVWEEGWGQKAMDGGLIVDD